MTRQIVERWAGRVLWEGEAATVKDAVLAARSAGANLRGADLMGANLRGADLRGADLTDADLTDANLMGANLTGADLMGANLRGADLRGADLTDADLTGANLTGADLRGANLTGANLRGADLMGANLRDAAGARAPVIPHIDARILAAVKTDGQALDMKDWHTCDTTHCRAGWAIHLAGEAGYALEDRIGSPAAGALIYAASRPGQRVPDFYATTAEAMADLEACAKADPLQVA